MPLTHYRLGIMSASEFPRSTTLTPAQRRRQSGIQKFADGLMEALEASEEIGEERVRDALDERYGQIDQRFAQVDQRFAQVDTSLRQIWRHIGGKGKLDVDD